MIKLGSSAGCLLVALFCVYGFLASGEYEGTKEFLWKAGYATVRIITFLGSVWQATRGR